MPTPREAARLALESLAAEHGAIVTHAGFGFAAPLTDQSEGDKMNVEIVRSTAGKPPLAGTYWARVGKNTADGIPTFAEAVAAVFDGRGEEKPLWKGRK